MQRQRPGSSGWLRDAAVWHPQGSGLGVSPGGPACPTLVPHQSVLGLGSQEQVWGLFTAEPRASQT